MRRPRVCFLVGGREGGGMALLTLQLIDGIDRAKFDVFVVSCEDGAYATRLRGQGHHCDVLETGWPPRLRRQVGTGARHAWLGYVKLPFWILSTLVSLLRYIRAKQIDIIHTNYHHFHFIAAMACVITRRKVVWHWHAPIPVVRTPRSPTSPQGGDSRRRDFRWGVLRMVSPILRRVTAPIAWSIANSRVTLDSLGPLAGDRATLVYNGIAVPEHPGRCGRLRGLAGLPEHARIVGLVGSLNPIKGHASFVRAAARICPTFPDVHFVYIGGETAAGQRDYLDSLIALRRELGVEDRVLFLGHRSDAAQLVGDFEVATVCTLSPGEGFGLVILEALAVGVPVISTDQGAAGEILTHAKTGLLIPAADDKALADAIHTLLSHDEDRRVLGEAGLAMCRERFAIEQTIRGVETVYERVLAR